MLMQAPPTGYSAGCVVRKKLVYLEELRRRGPDFGEFLQIPSKPGAPDSASPGSKHTADTEFSGALLVSFDDLTV